MFEMLLFFKHEQIFPKYLHIPNESQNTPKSKLFKHPKYPKYHDQPSLQQVTGGSSQYSKYHVQLSFVQPFPQQVEVQEEAAALFPPEGRRTSGRCRDMPTPG